MELQWLELTAWSRLEDTWCRLARLLLTVSMPAVRLRLEQEARKLLSVVEALEDEADGESGDEESQSCEEEEKEEEADGGGDDEKGASCEEQEEEEADGEGDDDTGPPCEDQEEEEADRDGADDTGPSCEEQEEEADRGGGQRTVRFRANTWAWSLSRGRWEVMEDA